MQIAPPHEVIAVSAAERPRGRLDALAARVLDSQTYADWLDLPASELEAAGLRKQIRDVKAGSSYASQNALALHFGLGKAATVDRLTVRRPGKVQVFEGVPADRKIVIE